MARILTVGVAVLDVIHAVERYPAEDAEMRAISRRAAAGGNAANTAQVLVRLGHECELAAVFAPDAENVRLEGLLHAAGVGTLHSVRAAHGMTPASFIAASRATGSRTIVHYRDLREFDGADFAPIPVDDFDWIHFEGRNVPETLRMMRGLRESSYRGRISVEAEKSRDGIESLFPYADVVVVSRAFLRAHRWTTERAFEFVHAQSPRAFAVCTQGLEGAVARDGAGNLYVSPACPPAVVLDTVGAGDAFLAGLVHALLNGLPPDTALTTACRVAGLKVGIEGFAISLE